MMAGVLNHSSIRLVKSPMRKVSIFWILVITGCVCKAQSVDKTAQDIYMISRMAEKFHVQPHPLDDEMSSRIYSRLLDDLDDERIIFLQDDINKLSAYKLQLDDEILNKRTVFLQLLVDIYKERLLQADSMMDKVAKTPFIFSTREMYTDAENVSWPASASSKYDKIRKLLKLYALRRMAGRVGAMTDKPSKKYIDSLEPALRREAAATSRRSIQRMLQSPAGIGTIVGDAYCQALAAAYDPHTDYFPPAEKEAFEGELGNKQVLFGFSLKEDDAGNVIIARLIPGSPAFRSGLLNAGDRFMAVQWENKELIDLSSVSLEEVNQVLATPLDGGGAEFTVKKTDGTLRKVTLYKAKVDVDEDNKVQGFVLRGAHTVGYISLPAFYTDWEDSKGIKGCSNDVAREIIRLKKEKMEGLILDLRYNGGGSMEEAVDLSGLFIDAGPVGQVKSKDGKTETLKDMTRGTIYDGPLIVLVNGFSASASEMVAGTLQDYNRALIVGSSTYGKATAQVVLPIDTTLDLDTYDGHSVASGYIKLTISRLYRVNGTTAQIVGVKPDVVLPDPIGSVGKREADEKDPLAAPVIDPNKYYRPLSPLPLAAAQNAATGGMDSSAFFKAALSYAQKQKGVSASKDVSLFLDDAIQEEKDQLAGQRGHAASESAPFTVANPTEEQALLQGDNEWRQLNGEYKNVLQKDPYIKISYGILVSAMIK